MSSLKNAYTYYTELPGIEALSEALEKLPYQPIAQSARSATSFINNPTTAELVNKIEGGCTFMYRHDKKHLPATSVNIETRDRIRKLEAERGQKLSVPERTDIKEQVTIEMLKVALVVTTELHIYYHKETKILSVATGSASLADQVICDLREVLGSLKAYKIRIPDLHYRMTNRLLERMSEGEPAGFEKFSLGNYVKLKADDGVMATFDTKGLRDPENGIVEATNGGCQVECLELFGEGLSFRLTKDFVFKSIRFDEIEADEDYDDIDDAAGAFRHEAGVKLMFFINAISQLCDLFDYQPDQLAKEDKTQTAEEITEQAEAA